MCRNEFLIRLQSNLQNREHLKYMYVWNVCCIGRGTKFKQFWFLLCSRYHLCLYILLYQEPHPVLSLRDLQRKRITVFN